ncbi:hypothetical protein SH528x_000192 [Novipirellula sp. SH528]|uniref:hypothetical protein n=1 Tax=Novipirellula sp. SH528 TaxID=3454466 RepID=UPI003F9F7FDC
MKLPEAHSIAFGHRGKICHKKESSLHCGDGAADETVEPLEQISQNVKIAEVVQTDTSSGINVDAEICPTDCS